MKNLITVIMATLVAVTGFAQQTKTKVVAKPVAKTVKKPVAAQPAVEKVFDNGIKLSMKGFVVSSAKLYFEDGTQVPEDNTVELNQKIVMQVVLDTGYKVMGGKVFPGGSEKITLDNGYEVLNSGDMFTQYDKTGVAAEDGKYVSLKAVMTQLNDKSKAINVVFRIWDKKSSSQVTGSYQFHIK